MGYKLEALNATKHRNDLYLVTAKIWKQEDSFISINTKQKVEAMNKAIKELEMSKELMQMLQAIKVQDIVVETEE